MTARQSHHEAPYMKNATFYLLDIDTTVSGLSAVEQLVCEIAAEHVGVAGKRVLIACEDEKQAVRGCEALWARPAEVCPAIWPERGPRGGAPVEIFTAAKRNSSPRDILISLRPLCQILPPLYRSGRLRHLRKL